VGSSEDAAAIGKLRAEADPEGVTFADRELEAGWQRHTMGYRDADFTT
jgi:hypothetical protein